MIVPKLVELLVGVDGGVRRRVMLWGAKFSSAIIGSQ